MRRFAWAFVLALLPYSAAAQQPPPAQEPKAPEPAVRVRFPPPSIRIGDVFRAELRVRLHFDSRPFDVDPAVSRDEFEFRRARVALEGRVLDDFEYELDADLRDRQHPWRDVFVNYRRWRSAEIQGGRFKVPFNLDQLTSVFGLNFVERSLIGSQVASGRDRGVMVHGTFGGGVVNYQTGWFEHDGDNVRFSEELAQNEFSDPPVDGSWAGRVEIAPWERTRGAWRTVQIGVNATTADVAEGLWGLRGRTLSGFEFFEPVYVKGRRIRLGFDGRWTPGPFSVQAEYNRVTDQRNGQGVGDVDLPDAITDGWYVAGSWAVTGERKTGGIEPRHGFLQGGVGAVEIAARIEELSFRSAGTGGEPPFTNPRAANIRPNRDRALTLGVNWYLNRFGRVTANAVREMIQDPTRGPLADRTSFWSGVIRLQFVM